MIAATEEEDSLAGSINSKLTDSKPNVASQYNVSTGLQQPANNQSEDQYYDEYDQDHFSVEHSGGTINTSTTQREQKKPKKRSQSKD